MFYEVSSIILHRSTQCSNKVNGATVHHLSGSGPIYDRMPTRVKETSETVWIL